MLTTGYGTKRGTKMSARMSALGGNSGLDMIASSSSGHDPIETLAAEFAVMHNAPIPRTVWYGETFG